MQVKAGKGQVGVTKAHFCPSPTGFCRTHTCETKQVNDSACHANPTGSCNLQLPWTPREALNCLNIGFSCHFRCCRVSGIIFSCGFWQVWMSHGSLGLLYQLCVGGLATLEHLKCSEQTVFWQWAPAPCVASHGKHVFSLAQESPSVKRPEWGKISPESGLLLQLWQGFCALYFSTTPFAVHVLGWSQHQGKGLPWNWLLCRAGFTSTVRLATLLLISYSIRQKHTLCLLWSGSAAWDIYSLGANQHVPPGTAEGCGPQYMGLLGATLRRRGCHECCTPACSTRRTAPHQINLLSWK